MPHLDEARGLIAAPAPAPAPASGPTFRAHANAGTSITSSATPTKMNMQVIDWDTGGYFSSSRFTPAVAGYYQISGALEANGTTNYFIAIIAKNGSPQSYGSYVNVSSNGFIGHVSDLVYLNGSTDYVELFGQSIAGVGNTGAAAANYFSGCWAHA